MMDDEALLALLQPFPGEAPCGVPMRYEPEYDQLREARRAEDPSLPTGVWQSELKRADWDKVAQLGQDILLARSKDLMVAAWLGEAWLHRGGMAGLSSALALVAQLCERFWDQLYPLPEDGDQSFRAGALGWLDSNYAAAVAAEVPLLCLDGPSPQALTLNGWSALLQRQLPPAGGKGAKGDLEAAKKELAQLHETVRSGPSEPMRQAAQELAAASAWLERLQGWCTEQMADEAPTFTKLRNALAQADQVLREFLAMQPSLPDPAPQPDQTETAAAVPAKVLGEPGSREEAYRQLAVIAGYLARAEPHSPVPYLIQRAVEWGGKPLHQLLAELIDSDPQARRLWALLGILPS
ncbi:type VI secretion system protein TssA [Gallaecimonas kandeliae]|uniref:type VI secretion system protein TssA n=1 Tax=Gallaecimonas kandeliae TaxID=3029055 RepID=UPI0026491AA5|nr:type VI secretion system protein TssA [Gallaecimonas kandeliae]WKE64474.1 type VI secretion system protein TssA [Gallaecimonas kandeliae]